MFSIVVNVDKPEVTIENGQPRHRKHCAQDTERRELQQITQHRKQIYYEKTTALTLFHRSLSSSVWTINIISDGLFGSRKLA